MDRDPASGGKVSEFGFGGGELVFTGVKKRCAGGGDGESQIHGLYLRLALGKAQQRQERRKRECQ